MATIRDLENLVVRINNLMKMPQTPYARNEKDELVPQAGNYHLDHGYGGVALHRMGKTGTGTHDISHGHFPKRELKLFLWGFVQALMETKFPRN